MDRAVARARSTARGVTLALLDIESGTGDAELCTGALVSAKLRATDRFA